MKPKSEWAGLLKYLENEERKKAKKSKPKVVVKIKEEPKKEKTKKHVKALTKEMMKETEVFSFVPAHVKKKYPTEGFNIRLFEEKLVNKLIEEHKKLQSYERPYISVSEVLYCLRACYYYRKKYSIDLKKKFNYPFLYIRQKVGNTVHDTIQDIYGFDEVEKTVISDKFHVKGRLDALEDVYLIDFKPSEKFREEVEMKHYDQGNMYATILNTEYDYHVKKIVIAYYISNFKDMQVFVKNVDLKRGFEFLNKGKLLKEHLDNNLVIDPIGATVKECGYCPYSIYCQKDGYKQVAPPKVKKIVNKKPEKKIEKPKKKTNNKKPKYQDPSDVFLL